MTCGFCGLENFCGLDKFFRETPRVATGAESRLLKVEKTLPKEPKETKEDPKNFENFLEYLTIGHMKGVRSTFDQIKNKQEIMTKKFGHNQNSILMTAVVANAVDSVKFLIEKGADVNTRNQAKENLLTQAIKQGAHGAVKFLVECNPGHLTSQKPVENSNVSYSDLARDSGRSEILAYLQKNNIH